MKSNHTNVFFWSKVLLVSLCVGLLVAVFSIFIQTSGALLFAGDFFNKLTASMRPAALDGGGTSFEAPQAPARLTIPSIGVDAHVQSVGLSLKGTGDIGIPSNFTDVAWFNQSQIPGFPGVAIIDGHVDGKNVPEAVFYNLDKLQKGDMVRVTDISGATLEFKVVESRVYDEGASTQEILAGHGGSELVLITCTGNWIASEHLYDKRVVVFSKLST